jgi:virginiamycin B lyase
MTLEEVRIAERTSGPYGITAGPDSALWLTMVHSGQIGRLDPGGDVRLHDLDSTACGPSLITAGEIRRAVA